MNRHKSWTVDENTILAQHYREGLSVVQDLLPGRTSHAIRRQACTLEITNWQQGKTEPGFVLPAMDLNEQLACVRFRKWCRDVQPNPRFGVAMIKPEVVNV